MDDLERLLIRREAFDLSRPARPGTGARAFVGKVTSTGGNIAAGKFLMVTPQDVTGSETEGGSGTFTGLSGSIPVYLVGPSLPATNDYLVCRRVDHRWVADMGRAIPGNPPVGINIPDCACQGTPASLSLTVTYPPGESAATYHNAYQSGTLEWYDYNAVSNPGGSRPSYLPPSAWTGAAYYSSASWINDFGFEQYFRMSCFSSQYALTTGAKLFGAWEPPVQTYNWNIGANTCVPFSLTAGFVPSGGGDFRGDIDVIG